MTWKNQNLSVQEILNLDKKFTFKSYFNFPNYLDIFKTLGWSITNLVYNENSNNLSFCNILIKSKYGMKFVYLPGGIEGQLNKKIINDLIDYIKIDKRIVLILINLHNCNKNIKIIPKSLNKIFNLHETRMVMKKELNLNTKLDYSKIWRHNLNRSSRHNFVIEKVYSPNLNEMMQLYDEMSKLKNYKINITYKFLELIFKNLIDNLIYYESRLNGRLIAFRCIFFSNNSAWDLLACSNSFSKKNYCTYKIMDKIFDDLISKKIKYFDFSGVDKKNNIGVYNFKKGTGSKEFLKYGEFVYSNIFILKYFFILFIFLKRLFIK